MVGYCVATCQRGGGGGLERPGSSPKSHNQEKAEPGLEGLHTGPVRSPGSALAGYLVKEVSLSRCSLCPPIIM